MDKEELHNQNVSHCAAEVILERGWGPWWLQQPEDEVGGCSVVSGVVGDGKTSQRSLHSKHCRLLASSCPACWSSLFFTPTSCPPRPLAETGRVFPWCFQYSWIVPSSSCSLLSKWCFDRWSCDAVSAWSGQCKEGAALFIGLLSLNTSSLKPCSCLVSF